MLRISSVFYISALKDTESYDTLDKEFYEMQLTEDREIVCPYCFSVDSDHFDLSSDGDTQELKCPDCGGIFDVEVCADKEYIYTPGSNDT